jgi:aryl-alcohol dehydrogenase-like predicted oxidoreductase
MEYRFLGSTGIQVSQLCMGTMTFGREADRAESAAIFNRCRNAGINFFDCANVYSQGKAEEILGELIADCRDELIITSKVWGRMGSDINAQGSSRRNIMAAVEASLRRLKTSYIDIYLLHQFDPYTPMEESLRALDDLVTQGKIRYTGASNFAAWQIAKALGVSALHDWAAFQCLQPMYNLVKRQAEVEILPLAQSENIAAISYNPLGGGLLTGKYGKDPRAASGRLSGDDMYYDRYSDEWMKDTALRFKAFAESRGFHPVSLAVAWVSSHPAITAPILGARNVGQIEDSLRSVEIPMTPDLYAEVSRLSPAPAPAHDRSEELKEKK